MSKSSVSKSSSVSKAKPTKVYTTTTKITYVPSSSYKYTYSTYKNPVVTSNLYYNSVTLRTY